MKTIPVAVAFSTIHYQHHQRPSYDLRFCMRNLDQYKTALELGRLIYCTTCWKHGRMKNKCQSSVCCRKCLVLYTRGVKHTYQEDALSCVQCGDNHFSLDSNCPVVKQYKKDLKAAVDHALIAGATKRTSPGKIIRSLQRNTSDFPELIHLQVGGRLAWQTTLPQVKHLNLEKEGWGTRALEAMDLIFKVDSSIITIKCRQCQSETSRTKILLDRGFKNDMKSIPIECFSCQWTGVLNNYQEHLDEHHSNLKCEYCNKEFNSVNKYNEHKISECEKLIVNCILKDFGCNEQIIRAEMEDHYLTEQHQHAIMKVVRQMLLQLSGRQVDNDLSQITTARTSNPGTAQLQELFEMLNILSGVIETLNNNRERLSSESLQFQVTIPTLTEELSKVKLSIEESNAFLEGVKHNQDILNQDLASLQEKINDFQYVSYDGTLVWKITNFQEKMIDAQSERQTSIYSPPFYSSPIGYKMRARLFLTGDGDARRTHMSLFFVLMRGLNDPILKFPFNYKVTFCLYDHTSAQRHIIDSFRPNIRSSSFQRPRSDMNIASGIPKFFPLEIIQQEGNPYVRDDILFIKIMVDFEGTHQTLLPYSLSLNPGLPTHVQQAMIKQEAERISQQQFSEQPKIPPEWSTVQFIS
ncbi:unnamed protein product [Rotaria sordida]|uniref:MATH domain-containing protein n=1 Tax=Rotaria sordida TaxID=392033 RepID=A0A813W2B0_9BILA|nr:unnamed protein product [Rotaria sordida]